MNTTEKLLLAEQARAEFERNIKALFGEHSEVSIGIHLNNQVYLDAPRSWIHKEDEGTRWVSSGNDIGHTTVFEQQR